MSRIVCEYLQNIIASCDSGFSGRIYVRQAFEGYKFWNGKYTVSTIRSHIRNTLDHAINKVNKGTKVFGRDFAPYSIFIYTKDQRKDYNNLVERLDKAGVKFETVYAVDDIINNNMDHINPRLNFRLVKWDQSTWFKKDNAPATEEFNKLVLLKDQCNAYLDELAKKHGTEELCPQFDFAFLLEGLK